MHSGQVVLVERGNGQGTESCCVGEVGKVGGVVETVVDVASVG
jgi:hypothetical protein